MMILLDIGGTHARFALYDGKTITAIEKYEANEHDSFESALAVYCSASNIQNQPALYIATAAYPDERNIWRFVNRNPWIIDPEKLKDNGWNVHVILNDFEAAAWALDKLDPSVLTEVKSGDTDNTAPLALIGPGTGLGLAYFKPGDTTPPHVQKTHGGHMLAACVSAEQWDIAQRIQKLFGNKAPPVFENFVSGPGLVNIYNALLEKNNKAPNATQAKTVSDNIESAEAQDALRLFHEFLALFAHTVVITSHSYGGVYMIGGMLERLREHGLFDHALFTKNFVQSGVKSVHTALSDTPVYVIDDPYLALSGLKILSKKYNE